MHHYNLGMLFEEVAELYGTQPALRYPKRVWTYADLAAEAEGLAVLLLQHGCQKGQVIAIAHTKQAPSYALMLAALRLGIAYVNVDVESPASRTLSILQTCGAKLLFCDDEESVSAMRELANQHGCPLCTLTEQLTMPSHSQREELQKKMRVVDGACIAYIMFTSGSTGIPKGVAVTHQSLLNFIQWGQQCFDIAPDDIFANLSPMYFDNSVFDFYVGLFNGASLAPVPRHLLTQPYELVAHVAAMQCSIWFCVPSLLIYLMTMKALNAKSLPTIRSFSFGGEGYPKPELKKLYDIFSAQARLVNVYGPTECTCICSAYPLNDEDFVEIEGLPPLGRLNQNFDYAIVAEEGGNANVGELHLMGPNVAAGYFNDIQRTEASFYTIREPENFGKRVYRTGDIVRENGGILYFIGRKDNQIKHMGYRIELEEIENALMRLPQVSQAAAIYKRGNRSYGKIIAYVAALPCTIADTILADLGTLLPKYMLPNKVIIMDTLPKNANGKVDRQALKMVDTA